MEKILANTQHQRSTTYTKQLMCLLHSQKTMQQKVKADELSMISGLAETCNPAN